MKKLLQYSKGAILPSLAIALGLVFWTTTASIVKAETAVIDETTLNQDTTATDTISTTTTAPTKPGKGSISKPGKGGATTSTNGCDVCHNPHNYHTINIPCDQVDKFVANHPGDFRGRCEVTAVTNP